MHPLEVHNDVTYEQLALDVGDIVRVTRDDGREEFRVVKGRPSRLGDGTWVIWIKGIGGCYALCRVQPYPEGEIR